MSVGEKGETLVSICETRLNTSFINSGQSLNDVQSHLETDTLTQISNEYCFLTHISGTDCQNVTYSEQSVIGTNTLKRLEQKSHT